MSDRNSAALPPRAAGTPVPLEGTRARLPQTGGKTASPPLSGAKRVLGIDKRPLTLAEAQATADFPTITSPASPAALASYGGGDLHIVATGMNPAAYADAIFTMETVGGDRQEQDTWTKASTEGVLDVTFTLDEPDADPIAWRSLRVMTYDEYRRTFMRIYN